MSNGPIRVLVAEQFNRAYRVPLLTRLSEHPDIDLTLVHGTSPPVQPLDVGINIHEGPLPFRTVAGPIEGLRWKHREVLWFGLALKMLRRERFDVVITDFYTRMLSIWAMQSIQHRKGAGVILWGIGFHQHRTPLVDALRRLMVSRTDALLLYSDVARNRYVGMGAPAEKCFVTQNTVDLEAIDRATSETRPDRIEEIRRRIGADDAPVLVHAGRLAGVKRLDLLIRALRALKEQWPGARLVLIGEGPEENALRQFAREQGVADSVHFPGSIMEHDRLAPWMLAADVVVAPAQIGLMGPMAQAYRRPLVISDEPKHLMPELQVFQDRETGLRYRFDDVSDLTEKIGGLLASPEERARMGRAGFERVREMTGPEKMMQAFLDAIHYARDAGRRRGR